MVIGERKKQMGNQARLPPERGQIKAKIFGVLVKKVIISSTVGKNA